MSESFELPSLADELRELGAVGVDVSVPAEDGAGGPPTLRSDDPARTDAAASWLMRRMAELDEEYNRINDAMKTEIQLVTAHYQPRSAKVAARRAELERLVEQLAREADFGKKQKSRKLAWGEYGRKLAPAHVEILDGDAVVAHCTTQAPQLLRATVKLALPEAQRLGIAEGAKLDIAKRELQEYVLSTGDVPEGARIVAEEDKPFVKVKRPVAAEAEG
jgi:hypothetical protein